MAFERPDLRIPAVFRIAGTGVAGVGIAVALSMFGAATGDIPMSSRPMGPMSAGGMPMMGTPVPGQTSPGAAASFLGMWVGMVALMMLPSLIPFLWRYYRTLTRGDDGRGPRPEISAALAAAGYLFVWTLAGVAVFPLNSLLAMIVTRDPVLAETAPIAAGLVVLAAGLFQFTAWKARHLACCQRIPEPSLRRPATLGAAWAHGLSLGRHCGACSAGLMAIMLVAGLMDLRVMILVTVAVTLERLSPDGARAARRIGVFAIGAGLVLTLRALGLG